MPQSSVIAGLIPAGIARLAPPQSPRAEPEALLKQFARLTEPLCPVVECKGKENPMPNAEPVCPPHHWLITEQGPFSQLWQCQRCGSQRGVETHLQDKATWPAAKGAAVQGTQRGKRKLVENSSMEIN